MGKNIQIWKSDVFYSTRLKLGEWLCWHPEKNDYLFADIKGKLLRTIDSVTAKVKAMQSDKVAFSNSFKFL